MKPRPLRPSKISILIISLLLVSSSSVLPSKTTGSPSPQVSKAIPGFNVPIAIAYNPFDHNMYVGNVGSNTVSVIDSATNEIVRTITAGVHPQGIEFNPFNGLMYVTNGGDPCTPCDDSLQVIDPVTGHIVKTIGIDGNPLSVVFNPQNNRIYVAAQGKPGIQCTCDGHVFVFDSANYNLITTIPGSFASYVMYNPVDGDVWLTETSDAQTVAIIDSTTNLVKYTIGVPNDPYKMVLNTFNNVVYVASHPANAVSLIDSSTHSLLRTITVNDPVGIAFNPVNNNVYVTNYAWGNVTALNSSTGLVTDTVIVGTNPVNIAFNPSNHLIYVAVPGDNTITVIDTGPPPGTPLFNPTGWTRKKVIIIDNTGNSEDLSSYQVQSTIRYSPAMQPDFRDIRFVDVTGHEIPHWIGEKQDGNTATVFIKAPFIPGSSTQEITMYYGNPSATSTSNGRATFDFFDDFEYPDAPENHGWLQTSTVFGLNGYNATTDTSYSRTGSRSLFTKGVDTAGTHDTDRSLIKYDLPLRDDLIFEGYFFHAATTEMIERIQLQTDSNSTSYSLMAITPDGLSGRTPGAATEYLRRYTPIEPCCGTTTNVTLVPNQWNSFKMVKTRSSFQGFILGQRAGPTVPDTTEVSSISIGGDSSADGPGGQPWWFDDVRIRKFADPEPIPRIGVEETVPSTLTVTPSNTITHRINDVFSLNVDVLDIGDLYSYDFYLNYDQTSLNVIGTECETGTLLQNSPHFAVRCSYDNTRGEARVAVTRLGNETGGGSGTLVFLSFKVVGVSSGLTSLRIDREQLIDSSFSFVPHITRNSLFYTDLPPIVAPLTVMSQGFAGNLLPAKMISFNASLSYDPDTIGGPLVTCNWSWGDLTQDSPGCYQTHTFASAGHYLVTLTVSDNEGSVTVLLDLTVYRNPDINTDNCITILDVAFIAYHFDSVQGSPGFDPRADIDVTGRVDILDIAFIAYYYDSCGWH